MILILGMQVVVTFIATFCIYMFFALSDNDFGIDGLVGLVIFQPIVSIILSIITIFICLIVGLPIRLSKRINYWWIAKFYIAIIGIVCGLTFLLLSIIPSFMETVIINKDTTQETLKQVPNTILVSVGWLLTAFSLLHLYPPLQLMNKIKYKFSHKHF
jgi:magnesium-transporting ATPase (P-type)